MARKLSSSRKKYTKKSIRRILAKSAKFGKKGHKSVTEPCPFAKKIGMGELGPNTPPVASFPENPNKKREQEAFSVFSGHQRYQNCGIQSARQIIEQANKQCLNLTELELLNESIEKCGAEKATKSFLDYVTDPLGDPHPKNSGGTTSNKIQCILKQHGVTSTVQDQSVKNLKEAIKSRKGIIANVDAGLLWEDSRYLGGGHAVIITDGKFDGDKLLGVYINDTGTGKRSYITLEKFLNSRLDGGHFNITDSPIWSEN